MIILNESIRLMNEGLLNGSGQYGKMIDGDGNETTIELPEEIHTFNGWKQRGYQVKKGEHAKAQFVDRTYNAPRRDRYSQSKYQTH
jgi:hypothetical protein